MIRCHYTSDKGKKILIPGCMGVAVYNDMDYCTCSTEYPQSFAAFERKEFKEKMKIVLDENVELKKEVFRLNRIIRKLNNTQTHTS